MSTGTSEKSTLSGGRPHEELEAVVGKWAGFPSENVVACSSGTAALHLALEAFRLPPRSAVVMPNLTMVACARAVVVAGLRPVFVGCGEDLLLSPRCLIDTIRSRHLWHIDEKRHFGAILAVHVYGRREKMGVVAEISDKMGVKVVEDLAEAHGIRPHHRTDAACWSFYVNKVVAGEEGGAVAFANRDHADLARSLRSLGFTDRHDFQHVSRGWNHRLADCLADKVLSSFGNLANNVEQRRVIEKLCDDLCPHAFRMPPRDVPWVYDLRVRGMTHAQQDVLVRRIQEAGVPARHCFKPMTSLAEFRDTADVYDDGLSAVLAREVVYLPLTPWALSTDHYAGAFDVLKRFVAEECLQKVP